jgi:phosphomannomutase
MTINSMPHNSNTLTLPSIPSSILREYDIRGTYGKSLNEDVAYSVGQRFTQYLKSESHDIPRIVVGRDGRLSSPALYDNLIKGIQDAGGQVIYIGVVPTPMVYYALSHNDAHAGIMVTGSHNPKDDNGFKMALKQRPFFGKDIQNLMTFQSASITNTPLAIIEMDIENDYLTHLKSILKGGKKLNVAWDPGHGATANIVTNLSKILHNMDHVLINNTIDGHFPAHHPDPTVAENLQDIIELVKNNQCDLGIAFDGDGDRVGVVDSSGAIVWGDQLLVFLARDVLNQKPGAMVITDVKSSQVLKDEIKKAGGNPFMWKTGHSLIKSKMKELKAALAGEMSGHIFYQENGYDDALYAAMRLLNILQSSDLTLKDMMDNLPKLPSTPELKFHCDDADKFNVINTLKQKLESTPYVDVDGIRFEDDRGWWLIRASNTQPILVGRCEGYTDNGLESLHAELLTLLKSVNIQ